MCVIYGHFTYWSQHHFYLFMYFGLKGGKNHCLGFTLCNLCDCSSGNEQLHLNDFYFYCCFTVAEVQLREENKRTGEERRKEGSSTCTTTAAGRTVGVRKD